MDVREKLVELLTDNLPRIGKLPKCDNPLQYTLDEIVERIADHLIAHGVTVQDWISVDEPPKERGIYQVFLWDKEMERSKVWYGQFTGYSWSVYDIYGDGMRCEVTHWMPIPEPPKGE